MRLPTSLARSAIQKNLPVAILAGTTFVTLLYVGINYVFIRVTPLGGNTPSKTRKPSPILASSHILTIRWSLDEWYHRYRASIHSGSTCCHRFPDCKYSWGGIHLILGKLAVRNRIRCILQASIALLLLLTSSFGSVDLRRVRYLVIHLHNSNRVYVARNRFPDIKRPFRVPGYPFTRSSFYRVWCFGTSSKNVHPKA